MAQKSSQWCVFLPCSEAEVWALPQNCLAEIVTIPADGEVPPQHILWRGREVPVLNLDDTASLPWRQRQGGTGLVAVMLGLRGEGCEYWAVALRGDGLGMLDLAEQKVEDCPDRALGRSVGAFKMDGAVYQIPDLLELQREITAEQLSF
jgi:hypothetical protein